MKKSTILLVSSDEEYVTSVEGSLSRSISKSFRLEFITDPEYLKKYFGVPHKIDVLIIEEKLLSEVTSNQTVGKTFVITESDRVGANLISKYLGAQGIIMLLGAQYMTREAGGEQIGTQIHDVIALSDPAFKTVTAIALSTQLSNFGKKVLYLSAENMQSVSPFTSDEGKGSVSNETQALAVTSIINGDIRGLDTLIAKGKFDYIPPFAHFLSSYGMSAATIFSLAEAIRKLEIYDEIVIEHPFGFGADSVSRLEKSKSIVIISGQDKSACDRLGMLFDNTREVADNCVLVCYPYEQTEPDYLGGFDTDRDIICERIERKKPESSLADLVENKVFRRTAEAVL